MPSRLFTHTGGMAAPMDVTEGDGGGKGGKALSVSRSSVKINKSNMRRAMTQPRPAPQVYKTEPAEFRSLVQRLTGTTTDSSSSSFASASPSALAAPKPLNPRLQKVAPPPLRPVFSYPTLQQALPQLSPQQQQQQQQFNPGPRRSFLSGLAYTPTPRHSNFPVSPLSFSPLPALSPGDQIWANVLNPGTSPNFPPPPATSATTSQMDFSRFGAADPYGLLGSLFTPSSLSMDDTFSFPDPDHIPRSRFS